MTINIGNAFEMLKNNRINTGLRTESGPYIS